MLMIGHKYRFNTYSTALAYNSSLVKCCLTAFNLCLADMYQLNKKRKEEKGIKKSLDGDFIGIR